MSIGLVHCPLLPLEILKECIKHFSPLGLTIQSLKQLFIKYFYIKKQLFISCALGAFNGKIQARLHFIAEVCPPS